MVKKYVICMTTKLDYNMTFNQHSVHKEEGKQSNSYIHYASTTTAYNC